VEVQKQKIEPILLGFGHKTKHGKDTASAHCAAKYGGKYVIKEYSFASALKVEVYDALLTPLHEYWATTKDYFLLPHPTKPANEATDEEKVAWIEQNKKILGNHLQLYGTEFRRAQDKFYWIKKTHAKITADSPQFAFIRDMRMPNEALYIKSHKGFTIKCNRVGYVNPDRDPNHISETALDNFKFDFVINHEEGDVAELLSCAEQVFEHIVSLFDIKVDLNVFEFPEAA
jgi:hypothetical protein